MEAHSGLLSWVWMGDNKDTTPEEDVERLLRMLSMGQVVFSILTYVLLRKFPVPWGRFRGRAYVVGPPVPMWCGWLVQEAPSALIPIGALLLTHFCEGRIFNIVALLAMSVHYVNRAFIYPIRHHLFPNIAHRKTVPLSIVVSAFLFCTLNGVGQSLSACFHDYSSEYRGLRYVFPRWVPLQSSTNGEVSLELLRKTSLRDAIAFVRYSVGLLLFFYGLSVNITSDEHLLDLKCRATEQSQRSSRSRHRDGFVTVRRSSRLAARKDGGETVTFNYGHHNHAAAYKIPRKGWFRLVSCANYWGEICEWIGYAIMCNTYMSASFAFFTIVFLACRGVQTHEWYRTRFGSKYPQNRYAVIPYVL